MSDQRIASNDLSVWTYEWVPEGPRGHVRDIRLRWALEEAGLEYVVRSVPFDDRGPEHLARQPFGQVPFLEDGEIILFESGACLLHLGRKSERLMPREPRGEAEVTQWLVSALNSVEMVTVPWWFVKVSGASENPLHDWMMQRFDKLEGVLEGREWLATSGFSIADILMADVLRIPNDLGELEKYPALRGYLRRALARPAFSKAHAGQLEHFEAADATRSEES
jgi:glutathione S-transferase